MCQSPNLFQTAIDAGETVGILVVIVVFPDGPVFLLLEVVCKHDFLLVERFARESG